MSKLTDLADRAAHCAVELCWRQWADLSAASATAFEDPAVSIVDPEALLLASLQLRLRERRLEDRLLWWAETGSALTSVQRSRTLAKALPQSARAGLASFAAAAVRSGDPRWKVFVDGVPEALAVRPGKGPRELLLTQPAALMVRLRAAFGVGIKADLLTYLIGVGGALHADNSVAAVARSLGYSVASTRRAANDMALARLLEVGVDRPVRYSVDHRAWQMLLRTPGRYPAGVAETGWQGEAQPRWRFWAQMYGFLLGVVGMVDDPRLLAAAPVVHASRLRDVAEASPRCLYWNGIEWIDPKQFPGERYLAAFEMQLAAVVQWVQDHR